MVDRLPTPPHRVLASGLRFPEGPVVCSDGSVLVVETRGGTIARIPPGGGVPVVVADLGRQRWGGPNGAAFGPSGALLVCHNGGFPWNEVAPDRWTPIDPVTGSMAPPDHHGGWIELVDPVTGDHHVVVDSCGGHRFGGPNDIVVDSTGGYWFTDFGKDLGRTTMKSGVYYVAPEGGTVVEVLYGMNGANGIGLSPDQATLYVAETTTGRLWAYDLDGPGVVPDGARSGRCLVSLHAHFDSLAVEESGRICVAAISDGICVVEPDGSNHHFVAMPDNVTTNVAFGGPDRRTAYVTLSGSGELLEVDWPRPGLPLAFADQAEH